MRRRRQRQRGAAFLEAALTMTVFLTILFGIMDFGRLVWWDTMLADAAREGSRYASMRGSSVTHPATASDVTADVKSTIVAMDTSAMNVSTTWSPNNKPGSTVSVTVTYPFSPLVPYIPTGTITLTSTSAYTITQ